MKAAKKNNIKENSAKFLWQIYRKKLNLKKSKFLKVQCNKQYEDNINYSMSKYFHSKIIQIQKLNVQDE